mmetsp:Transcript_117594/g.366316  ORF Transcript_117594/g.366316 Transcript_117594/m.366316 type:complete len:622 (+) Transcript_117594:1750-3615(+)
MAPEVWVRLMPRVEDAEEHALGHGVGVLARAEEAVAELQQVHHEVQAAALAPHAAVWHEEVLLHEDRCVVVLRRAPLGVVAHVGVRQLPGGPVPTSLLPIVANGDKAHARLGGGISAVNVVDELEQGGRRVVEDQRLLPIDVHHLFHDLAVAEAAHLPVGVRRAVLHVVEGVLLVLGGGEAASHGTILREALQEGLALPVQHALHAAAGLLAGGRRPRPLREALVLGPRRPGLLLGLIAPHGVGAEAGPEVLVQIARLVDALAVGFRLGTRDVDHNHLAVPARRRLPEVQGELCVGGVVRAVVEEVGDCLAGSVRDHHHLLVLVLRLEAELLHALLDVAVQGLLPAIARLHSEAVLRGFVVVLEEAEPHDAREDAVVDLGQGGLHPEVVRDKLEDLRQLHELRQRVLLELHAALRNLVAGLPRELGGLLRHHRQDLPGLLLLLPPEVEGGALGCLVPGQVLQVRRPLLQELERRVGVQKFRPGRPEDAGALTVALVAEDVDPPAKGWKGRVVELRPGGDLADPVPEHRHLGLAGGAATGDRTAVLLQDVAVGSDLVPGVHGVEVREVPRELAEERRDVGDGNEEEEEVEEDPRAHGPLRGRAPGLDPLHQHVARDFCRGVG